MSTRHYSIKSEASKTFYFEPSNIQCHDVPPVASRGRTQQWPTELTGRGFSYWLSIHRSSPRVPGLASTRRTGTGAAGPRGHVMPGGSLQVTALPLEHTYSFHMELLLHPACPTKIRTDTPFRSSGDLCHLERKQRLDVWARMQLHRSRTEESWDSTISSLFYCPE